MNVYLFSGSTGRWFKEGDVVRAVHHRVLKGSRLSGNIFYVLQWIKTFKNKYIKLPKTCKDAVNAKELEKKLEFTSTSVVAWLSIFRHFSRLHWQFSPHVIFPLRHLHCLLPQRPLQAHWGTEITVMLTLIQRQRASQCSNWNCSQRLFKSYPNCLCFLGDPASLLGSFRTPFILLLLTLTWRHQV